MEDRPPAQVVATSAAGGGRFSAWARKLRADGPLDGPGAERLLRLFGVLSVAAGALIIALSTLGSVWLYRGEMIREAEETAVSVGRAIFANERDKLVVRDSQGNEALHVPAERVAEVDRIVRNYLEPFRIHKIKMFSGDKRVIYSTDHGLIGRRDPGNETLEHVLRERRVDSAATQKNQMTELGGTVIENRQIVETYLPIISGERLLGAFEVYVDITDTNREIARVVTTTAIVMAAVVALTMIFLNVLMRRGTTALLRAHARLDGAGSADPLTGVLDRHALIRHSQRELADLEQRGVRQTAGLGLVMVDIDRFKDINDQHGREAGDHVLQALARRLQGAIRKGDMIGRYGGEEFLLLLRGSTRSETIALAERLRNSISATPIELPGGGQVTLTASLGVNVLDKPDQNFEAAVRAADEALFWAKHSGRNRVRAAE